MTMRGTLISKCAELRTRRQEQRSVDEHDTLHTSPGQSVFGLLVPLAEASDPCYSHTRPLPLSVDHILSLTHVNAFRALLANSVSLALSHVFGEPPAPGSYLTPALLPTNIPPSLVPTILQLTIPHEPTIDFFPLARLRDNFIAAGSGLFQSGELCRDMLGTLFANHDMDNSDRNGLIVWAEAWDVNSWECTPGFLRKWGWLLDGCEELLHATDRWRAVRGERPISIYK